jgi:tetratricopeptide (TPR) repeat protein
MHGLGNLFSYQGKLAEAEQMYERALQGYEEALGPNHTSTLGTVGNLGNLYADQGKLAEAEQMYERALQGYEEALGPNHTSTLLTVNNLGNLYADQGKLAKTEQMCKRMPLGRTKMEVSHPPRINELVYNTWLYHQALPIHTRFSAHENHLIPHTLLKTSRSSTSSQSSID